VGGELVRSKPSHLRVGPLMLDRTRERLVFPDGSASRLSHQEALLLGLLATSLGRTVHRDVLVSTIWGDEQPETNAIDVLAFRIRRKLGAHARMLKTVRGAGLRVELDETG
jgi:DNA-binding response OmpR family regulator